MGVMDTSTSSKNHKNEDILDLGKVKIKNDQFPANLNIPMELLASPVVFIQGENGAPDLSDPKLDIFIDFTLESYRPRFVIIQIFMDLIL